MKIIGSFSPTLLHYTEKYLFLSFWIFSNCYDTMQTDNFCTCSLQRHVRLQLNQRSGCFSQRSVDVFRKSPLAFNTFTCGDGAEQQQHHKTHRDLHSRTGSLLLNCAICKPVCALYRSLQQKTAKRTSQMLNC